MNRLIDRARDAAWMLAEYIVMNEVNVDRQRMMGDEVGRVIRCGSMMMSTEMMLRLANMLNALQAFAEEFLGSEILRLRRETPVYMYRTDPTRPEKTLPFHKMHAEACASALALGFRAVFLRHNFNTLGEASVAAAKSYISAEERRSEEVKKAYSRGYQDALDGA